MTDNRVRFRLHPGDGVAVCLLSLLFSFSALADDWPQWRGPNRNGISAETNWLVNWPPPTAWTQNVHLGYSSVAIVSNRLYTMGWDGTNDVVYCLDAANGTRIWTHAYACPYPDAYLRTFPGPRATPTVNGNRVYTYSHLGHVFCLDASSGGVIWSNIVASGRLDYGLSSSPLVERELLILNAGSDGTALDKNTGTNVWASADVEKSSGYASPFAMDWNGQRVAVLFTRSGLDGIDAATGEKLWWYAAPGKFSTADPIVYGDMIFITNLEDWQCHVLQLKSGELTRVPIDPWMYSQFSTPILLDDHLYGFHGLDTLACVDIRDGATQWTRSDFGLQEGGLTAADGKLIVVWERGDLAVVDATPSAYVDSGRPTIKITPAAHLEEWQTAPVLANGRIYCRSRHGSLVCLRTGAPAADVDRNGMADNWERMHFGRTNSVPIPATGDPDHDGWDNRTEYLVGTVPTNADNGRGLEIAVSNTSVVVRYETQPANGVGYEGWSRYYRLEAATTMLTDNWLAVDGHDDVPGDGGVREHTNPVPSRAGMYRIGVRLESEAAGH